MSFIWKNLEKMSTTIAFTSMNMSSQRVNNTMFVITLISSLLCKIQLSAATRTLANFRVVHEGRLEIIYFSIIISHSQSNSFYKGHSRILCGLWFFIYQLKIVAHNSWSCASPASLSSVRHTTVTHKEPRICASDESIWQTSTHLLSPEHWSITVI